MSEFVDHYLKRQIQIVTTEKASKIYIIRDDNRIEIEFEKEGKRYDTGCTYIFSPERIEDELKQIFSILIKKGYNISMGSTYNRNGKKVFVYEYFKADEK